nr:hypothetical protein [uncultured Draconibacterium sp.]
MTTTEIINRAFLIARDHVEVISIDFRETHKFKSGKVKKEYHITIYHKPNKTNMYGNFSATQDEKDNAKGLEVLFSRLKNEAQENSNEKLSEPFEIKTDLS